MILIHERRERQFLTAQCEALGGVPLPQQWKMREKRTRPEHFAQVLSLVIETLNNEGITIAVRFQLFAVGREDNP